MSCAIISDGSMILYATPWHREREHNIHALGHVPTTHAQSTSTTQVKVRSVQAALWASELD